VFVPVFVSFFLGGTGRKGEGRGREREGGGWGPGRERKRAEKSGNGREKVRYCSCIINTIRFGFECNSVGDK